MTIQKKGKLIFHLLASEPTIEIPHVGGINAGFASPAQDYMASKVDLNSLLIKHPSYTFMAFADGDCLEGSGVADRDLVLVDKSLQPNNGDLVVCYIDGEFTMKRIKVESDRILLMPDPAADSMGRFKPIEVTEDNTYIIWGVVTYVIKKIH